MITIPIPTPNETILPPLNKEEKAMRSAEIADRHEKVVDDLVKSYNKRQNEISEEVKKKQAARELEELKRTSVYWLQSPKFKETLKEVLPKHLSAERVCRIAITDLRSNYKLGCCSPASVLGSLMICSQLGLEVGNALGHAYLVPYKGQCQFILGYKGMIHLALQSGKISTIQAQVVREGDIFTYEYGFSENLKHVPQRADNEEKPIIYAYAYAKTIDGHYNYHVMDIEALDKIKSRSPTIYNTSSPWKTDHGEMCCKTVVRRLFKYLPVSQNISKAIALDEAAERGEQNNEATINLEDFEYEVSI